MSAGSPFGLLAQVVRRAAGFGAGEPGPTRFQKLRARLGRHLEGIDLDRVSEFLGELAGAPAPDPGSVQLRAARRDPVLMGDQMRRAWEDWLAVECGAGPVVLVLEDLQWGDLPTVKFVDAALRNLRELPLFVLAAARPEVHELFPKLWAERRIQEIRLGELTRRASERLVRETLGTAVPAETVARLIEQAGGNALYLEELIRAAAEGRSAELPETVIAMVQARLEGLDPEARRILRAASVFGGVFWRGGVIALLGGADATHDVESWLAILADRELVSRRPESRFPAEDELGFRHEIVREAAYAMLTDEDRVLGHRLAGEWLLSAGEDDAALLAQHFERGQDPVRAAGFYARAAADAFEGNDFVAATERAERALACGAEGAAGGTLRLVQAEAHGWRGENAEAQRHAEEAMTLLPRGGPEWYIAAAQLCEAAGKLGSADRVEALGRELGEVLGAGASPSVQALVSLARAVPQLLFLGHYELAGALLGEIDRAPAEVADDPAVAGWITRARAVHAMFAGDAGRYLELAVESVLCFDRVGDVRNATRQRNSVGFASIEVGMLAKAERALIDALTDAERMGLHVTAASARQNLGLVRARQGALEEARAILGAALGAHRDQGDLRMEGGARVYLAIVELLSGDLERAEAEAVRAADVLRVTPPGLSYALAVLAQVRLARGDADLALFAAQEAMEILEGLGVIEEGESAVRLALAESLWAAGRPGEAREVILAARQRLEERARRMTDPVVRLSFLAQVRDNARTVDLAEDWGVISASG
jgi:tetratricopeptide (TPR) repeat protein